MPLNLRCAMSSLKMHRLGGIKLVDIFVSYSQKDRAWVKRLVDALTAEGWAVWWHLKIRSGEAFDEAIERKLEQVGCVVAGRCQGRCRII